MAISFVDYFRLDESEFEKSGVFDTILDTDSLLYVDPALVRETTTPEFANAGEKIETFFSSIISLVQAADNESSPFWKKADNLFTFTEITNVCLGYTAKGTGGNAIGKKLRSDILTFTKELLKKGNIDPILFELMCIFQEDIGCDRISDLIIYILQDEIKEYTKRILSVFFEKTALLQNGLIINPFNDLELLLLPKDILTALSLALDFSDIDYVSAKNQSARIKMHEYFKDAKGKRVSKATLMDILKDDPEFRDVFVESYKKTIPEKYDFSKDVAGEIIWYSESKRYTSEHPISLLQKPSESLQLNEILNIAGAICSQFKHLIEDCNLYQLLYDTSKEEKTPKHESAAQLIFYGIASSYCKANNYDLSREVNNGRGPVDFKISRGQKEKIIIEAKLSSNKKLDHAIETQIPIYIAQEEVQKAIYLLIDVGQPQKVKKFIERYNSMEKEVRDKITLITIDGQYKDSASKA